jgi:hypothetical protein
MRLAYLNSHSRLRAADAGIAEELVLRLKALVHMRTLLERSGPSTEEIEKRTAEINRVRLRLAELVRESAEDYGSATRDAERAASRYLIGTARHRIGISDAALRHLAFNREFETEEKSLDGH